MRRRSAYIPSTARNMLPSGPRSASDVPSTDSAVVPATHCGGGNRGRSPPVVARSPPPRRGWPGTERVEQVSTKMMGQSSFDADGIRHPPSLSRSLAREGLQSNAPSPKETLLCDVAMSRSSLRAHDQRPPPRHTLRHPFARRAALGRNQRAPGCWPRATPSRCCSSRVGEAAACPPAG